MYLFEQEQENRFGNVKCQDLMLDCSCDEDMLTGSFVEVVHFECFVSLILQQSWCFVYTVTFLRPSLEGGTATLD